VKAVENSEITDYNNIRFSEAEDCFSISWNSQRKISFYIDKKY